MKKLMIITLALLAMSCSSDDEEDTYTTGKLELYLAEFFVNMNAWDADLKRGEPKLISTPRANDRFVPKSGVFLFYTPSGGLKATNPSCPCGGKLVKDAEHPYIYGYIGGVGECGSQFDPTTGLPIAGPAKEKKLRLLEYKVIPQENDGVYLVTDK